MEPYLSTKDYTVTGEKFDLNYVPELDMLQTTPIPNDLDSYYESSKYISHTDSKKTIIDKLYQIVKLYSLYKKGRIVEQYNTSQKTILDIGAGTGDFLRYVSKKGWTTAGIEPNPSAKNRAAKKGITLKTDYNELGPKKYDIITLWHVLEHLPNLENHIQEIKNRMPPEGTLIIAVPNYKSYDAQYYGTHWAAYDVPRHLHHFSPKSISLLFKRYDLDLIKTIPMVFDSFYVSLLSEKYKTGKSNYARAFYTGLLSNIKAMGNKQYSSLIYILKNTQNQF